MAQRSTTRPEIRGTFGAVAITHWIATAAGFGVLERGGNAFDAAVATGLTLQAAPAAPGLGFNVTTRGQMFWMDERLPSHLAPGGGRAPR